MNSQSGFTLVGLLIAGALTVAAFVVVSKAFVFSTRSAGDGLVRTAAHQELELLATAIKKDLERHGPTVDAVEVVPGPFAAPGGTPVCYDITVRQTAQVNVTPPIRRRIEYRTACTGAPFPSGLTAPGFHPQLNTSCSLAPQLTITTWPDDTKTSGSSVRRYPRDKQVGTAVCFIPDQVPEPGRIDVQIRLAYPVERDQWHILSKTFPVFLADLGTAVEILPPQ